MNADVPKIASVSFHMGQISGKPYSLTFPLKSSQKNQRG